MSLEPGSSCGPYEIVAPLGTGGMGQVFRARDPRLGREVAIKVLREEYASDTDRLTRFEQEARAASALNHPHIVTIFDIGESDGRRFIAMELIGGRTLRDILKSGPLGIRDALDVAVQAADGLAKAHDAGIAHRDLKPENVMITEEAFVKILDFGLAKLVRGPFEVDSEGPTMAGSPTRAGTLLGTVEYMSPEQASGRAVDHRTDQFSLGLVIYEMVTGERPFQRETVPQTLAAIIEADVPRLNAKDARVPSDLADVVERCLAKKAVDRFHSTRDLARTLRGIKEGGVQTVARPPSAPRREALVVPGRGDFYVQTDKGVQRMDEARLRRRLRRRKLSGLELVRRDGQEAWIELHETRIYREEVPLHGEDPRETARWRVIREFGGHLSAFVGVGIGMTLMTGQVPFWLAFWGIGLLAHAFRVLPAAVGLWRDSRARLPQPGRDRQELRSGRQATPLLSPSFVEEVDRVRGLLDGRPKEEGRELLAEIDRLVESVSVLTAKERDLEEQTSASERDELRAAEEQAQAKLAAADTKYDRQLFQRQVDVLASRRQAVDKALLQLERMRVRKSLAEHQLKQLRLDLSQAEARRLAAPELSSRILDIRHEVDAFDEADELLADV